MNTAVTASQVSTRRPWDRFPAAEENEYRQWTVAQMRQVGTLLGLLSLVLWLTMPLHTLLVLGAQTPSGIYLHELVVLPAVCVIWVLLLQVPATRGSALTWNMVAVLLGYSGTLFIVRDVYGITAGGAVYTTIFYCMFLPLLRAPFRATALLSVVVTGIGTVVMSHDVAIGLLTLRDAYPAYTMLAAVALLVTLVSLLVDHNSRRSWDQARLIELQRGELAEGRRLIRRYVPPAVADRLEVGDTTVDAAQRRRVTVLSSDVVGFTVMADRLDPEALAEVINDYIAALADLLDRHHGTVTEFAGDGMMALFGAPDDLDPETQVRSAVAAAHELHDALPQWSKRWYRLGITAPLQARVGINTGVVSVGTFGSSVRATYTGIGIQMNIAARIQAEATPGTTLISNTSWHLTNDTTECRAHGEVLVKGVHYPIEMYEPMHL